MLAECLRLGQYPGKGMLGRQTVLCFHPGRDIVNHAVKMRRSPR
jgi:hypothetical protein